MSAVACDRENDKVRERLEVKCSSYSRQRWNLENVNVNVMFYRKTVNVVNISVHFIREEESDIIL